MSGIAGIFNLDGRPVDRAQLEAMTQAIAHRGPDGAGLRVLGPVGLGHRMLRTTPESVRELQPLEDDRGDDGGTVCLTLDGRIDNGPELRTWLQGARRTPRDDTDAELILQAYLQWGRDCARRIVGDFAFALWDGRSQQLFCARDFLGTRPLYYHCDGRTLRLASEPQAVLADSSISREPNEGMVAEFLAGSVTSTTETFFRGLRRLPGAHWLLATERGVRVSRYWSWEPIEEVRHRTDADYGAHFLSVFTEAVSARMRAIGAPASELSGGVDSSTVVTVAQSLLAGRGDPLDTYSEVFPGLACDETPYIDDVVSWSGVRSHRYRPEPIGAAAYEEQVARYLDLPVYPNMAMSFDLNRMVRGHGSRVLLTGEGGDDWLTGSVSSCADLIRHLRPVGLSRQLSEMTKGPGWPTRRSLLWQYGLKPLIAAPVRDVRHRVAGGRWPWITESFARRVDLTDRLRTPPRPKGVDIALWEQVQPFTSGEQAQVAELTDRTSAWFGVERRDPFHDRRHVEFALGLPEAQRWHGPHTKYVLRTAMGGLLPESVRWRATKAEFSHPFADELLGQGGVRLFQDMAIERLGWVHGAELRRRFTAMQDCYLRGDDSYSALAGQLWNALSVERWVRAVGGRRGGANGATLRPSSSGERSRP